ncbi:MAG: SCP2 sterol-binding domain-containing protein [Chloroflexota bacterium]|nr:SCP2 sterol-binding domain-containing protein [Chloroflexota bacterium]
MKDGEQAAIPVRLLDGDASSGLGLMTMQYLEQTLEQAPHRRRQARNLHGRVALQATDADVTITVSFQGDEIEIQNGAVPPLDAYVGGPYEALTDLLAGRANPVLEHLRGRLRVRSRVRDLFLPYRVYNLLRLSPAGEGAAPRKWLWGAVVLAAVSAGVAVLILRRSRTGGGR